MRNIISVFQRYRYIKRIDLIIFFIVNFILLSCFLFFYMPCVNGNCAVKFYFDSLYYLEYSDQNSLHDFSDFLGFLFTNRLGPYLVYKICQGNNFLILVFNSLILWYSLLRINDLRIIRSPLLWINLILVITTVSISKEIFIVLYSSLLYSFIEKKKLKFAVWLIIISIFVRWQLLAATSLIIFYISFHKIINKRTMTYLFLGVFILTYSYVVKNFVIGVQESINYWVNKSIETRGEGLGIYLSITGYDRQGFYFLTFLFKFIFLAISGAIKFLFSFNLDLDYFHNFAEVTQSFGFIFILRKWKLIRSSIEKEHLMVLTLLAIFFTAVQIFTPRYLFPIYLYSLILWQKTKKSYYLR